MSDNLGAQKIRLELERRKALSPPQGQKELAEELGMSQSFVSRLATGEKVPKLAEDARSLSRLLGIELDDFEQPPAETSAA